MNDEICVKNEQNVNGGGAHGAYDIIKVILAYIVILRHFTQSFLSPGKIYSALICGGISTAAVPIYFIISGYLFFSKPFSRQRLKHQLMRILKLYLAWTVIYIPLILLKNILDKIPMYKGICSFVQDFIFSGSYFHLWYLPALIFALTFVSLIRNLKIQYAAILSMGLFIIGLLYESYRFLVPQLQDVFDIYSKIFLTTRNGLFFGTIYVFIGYVFSQNETKINCCKAILGILISIVLLCLESVFLFEYRKISVANLTIFALPAAVYTFAFARNWKIDINKENLTFFRKFSTVLFCVHPIFTAGISFVDSHFVSVSTGCAFILVILGATILSVIIVKLSEKFKLISNFV